MLRTTVALLTLAFALTGCGSAEEPAAADKSTPEPTKKSTPKSTPSPTPTPTPTPTEPPRPKPADGTKLRACYDGDCEVLVTEPGEITVDGKFGFAQFGVSGISKAGVDFEAVTADGTIASPMGQLPDQGGPSTVNDLSMLVVWLDPAGKSAVIRLTPK